MIFWKTSFLEPTFFIEVKKYCIEYLFANYANIRVVINTSSKWKFGIRSPEQEFSLKDENGDLIDLICNVAKALMQWLITAKRKIDHYKQRDSYHEIKSHIFCSKFVYCWIQFFFWYVIKKDASRFAWNMIVLLPS